MRAQPEICKKLKLEAFEESCGAPENLTFFTGELRLVAKKVNVPGRSERRNVFYSKLSESTAIHCFTPKRKSDRKRGISIFEIVECGTEFLT